MRLALFFGAVFFVSACATPRVDKMSFSEALPARLVAAPPPVTSKPPPKTIRRPVASTSLELQSALARFAARARENRSAAERGSPMPASQVENWQEVHSAVDAFLAGRDAAHTSSLDLIRARVMLEAELDLDARAYGDVPAALPDEVHERVTHIALRMDEVRRLGVKTRKSVVRYRWPVQPVAVTSVFGRRLHPISRVWRPHNGIDLAAADGQAVSASAEGTVIRAAWNGAHGNQIEILHGGHVVTRYSHLAEILVDVGTLVKQGEVVGLAGSTGQTTGPHLHFEFWKDGKPTDPLAELSHPSTADEVPRPIRQARPKSTARSSAASADDLKTVAARPPRR